jgi:hypothetical protein
LETRQTTCIAAILTTRTPQYVLEISEKNLHISHFLEAVVGVIALRIAKKLEYFTARITKTTLILEMAWHQSSGF